jgi:hypothetical protein
MPASLISPWSGLRRLWHNQPIDLTAFSDTPSGDVVPKSSNTAWYSSRPSGRPNDMLAPAPSTNTVLVCYHVYTCASVRADRGAERRQTQSSRFRLPALPVRLCCLWRIVICGDGGRLWLIESLLGASRLAALLKLRARYPAENTNLALEGEPVISCRPIKSHRCPPH